MHLKNKIQALFNSEQYHGWDRTRQYFEGWYYKIINADESEAYAIIPGIAMDADGTKQSFIQILDGKKFTAEYHRFSSEEFIPSAGKFDIKISDNRFHMSGVNLNLQSINGNISFENRIPWPNPWYSPGIMGPFSFVPFMQCYHGILSMDHKIKGALNIGGKEIDFTDG